MKNYLLLLLILFSISCSNDNDDEPISNPVDHTIAPSNLKGDWKVDYYELKSFSGINNNTNGQFFKVSSDSKVSYKDYYLGSTNSSAIYSGNGDFHNISMMQNQITMDIRPSFSKPGYTEINISYNGAPEKNSTLYAKKQ